MGNPYLGYVSWDRRGEDRIGVFLPAGLNLFRVHVNGLRKLILRRLAEHASGDPLGPLDCRLEHILLIRGASENNKGASELEILFPVVNRLAEVLAAIPETGGVVVLHGGQDCYRWGSAAIDITIAITELVRRWWRGEEVDGMRCPGRAALAMWCEQFEWLNSEIVDPLKPDPVDAA